MKNHNHAHNFALFVLLLSLLFIPVGSFGLVEVSPDADNVLSASSVREVETVQLDAPREETLSVIEEDTEEATEATLLTPDLVVPFYR